MGDEYRPGNRDKRLDSWKSIAEFLGRDVRSVQRWERERGLPVHRVPGERGGGVFAYTDELNGWLHSRDTTVMLAEPDAESALSTAPAMPQGSAAGSTTSAHESLDQAAAVSAPAIQQTNIRHRPVLPVAIVAAVLALAAAIYAVVRWLPARAPVPVRVTLAVLPFINLSGNPEQDYFADGLTEEMITDLSRLNPGALGVIARTSAMKYKGTHEDVAQIGRELNANYILEGSVRRAGGEVRVSAQLIRVSDQTHVWARNYERHIKDVLQVQSEVAQAIADRIQLNLTPQQQSRLASPMPSNPEAYDNYLKGLYFLNRRGLSDLQASASFFTQAARLDPGFAPAKAGLAQCYTLLALDVVANNQQMAGLARDAATKAVMLDASSASALTSLAAVHALFDYNWPEARRGFERAIALNSNYALARHWYAVLYLDPQGRFDEAVSQLNRALEIDPLSLIINTDLGFTWRLAGRNTDALRQYQKVLAMDNTFVPAHYRLASLYEQTGAYDKWLGEYLTVLRLINDPELGPTIQQLYARGGYHAVLRRNAETMGTFALPSENSRRSYGNTARVLVTLGQNARALSMLEKSYARREPGFIYLKVDPAWAPLRSEPRFQALERQMGLLPPTR